jgi:hypothetical protein
MNPNRRRIVHFSAASAGLTLIASAVRAGEVDKSPINAGPYVPSPDGVVAEMLEMAQVGPTDFVIDMGSGDGRIVLTAAKLRGARGLGIEIQPDLVALSQEAARRQGIADKVSFVRQDLFRTDVSKATVVTLYLLPDTVNLLAPKLQGELRPGTRVLSHDYPLAGWLPESHREFEQPEKKSATGIPKAVVYLYRVPAQVGGRWRVVAPAELARQPTSLALRQQWQKLDGMATLGGREIALQDVVLSGEAVSLSFPVARGRIARVDARAITGTLEGTVTLDGQARPWRATREG